MFYLIKKVFDDDKKNYLYDRFFVPSWNFTADYVKNEQILVFSGFLQKFSNFRFIQVFQGF